MKKKHLKAVAKEQKKALKKDMLTQIVAAMQTVTLKFGSNKKIEKFIEKKAKQITKKIAGEIKEVPSVVKPAIETPVKVIKKPVKKEEKPA